MKVSRFAEIVASKSDEKVSVVKKVLRHTNKCALGSLYNSIKLVDERDILEAYCTTL